MRTISLAGVVLVSFGQVGLGQAAPVDPFVLGLSFNSRPGCAVVVQSVVRGSPAERAGVRQGDRLLQVDGVDVSRSAPDASQLLRPSDQPGSVNLALERDGKKYTTRAQRERASVMQLRTGRKIVRGLPVLLDATEAEVERMLSFDDKRMAGRVFPTHYPENLDLYYGGFELFLLKNPREVWVGGIEEGPASRAGVHWGDQIVSVNGVAIAEQPPAELERLFSSPVPLRMQLKFQRAGEVRSVQLDLEKASAILNANGKQIVNGDTLPANLSAEDLRCFTQKK